MNLKRIAVNAIKVVAALLCAAVLYFAVLIAFIMTFLLIPQHTDFFIIMAPIFAVLLEVLIIWLLWRLIKKKLFYIPLCIAFGIWFVVLGSYAGYHCYVDSIQTVGESGDLLSAYEPYGENSKAVVPFEESTLTITDDIPVMDGATALYPIYASFAKAVYPREVLDAKIEYGEDGSAIVPKWYLKCTTTTRAYENIVTGEADIIFAALPSEEQEQFAADNGVELVYTPIGKEAFVFFVNAKNPIEGITVEQIQGIYSGEITAWSELGVRGLGEIRAFQRDAGSGSQSTLEKLMAGKQLMKAPTKDVISGMEGIIQKAADYKNYKNAIGYSFRFYSTEMVSNDQIKLLSINGVYPSLENIENGTYPLASCFYAVTRKDADENTLKLLEWIVGEQGQMIIEAVGYTPLR